jgi:3-carboxy-cis,cis-muconate cycloisomerase
MQHALPTTFGLKCAVWLSMIERHRVRLSEITPRVLVVQFAGAAGTLASLGSQGLAVQDALAQRLKLGSAPVPWHVARDTLSEAVSLLALITGSLAKIGNDIVLMMQTELGEVFEPFVPGRGASSTMPQKRNPVVSEQMAQAASSVRGDLALILESLARSDHERASGPWTLEWMAIPRAFVATGGALERAIFLLDGLVVDSARMAGNLDLTGGLIVAEAVMMALAPKMGRGPAHDLVYGACRTCLETGARLVDVLKRSPDIRQHVTDSEIEALANPKNYLGSTDAMIDRMIKARRV